MPPEIAPEYAPSNETNGEDATSPSDDPARSCIGPNLSNRSEVDDFFDSDRFIQFVVNGLDLDSDLLENETRAELIRQIHEYAEGMRFTLLWVRTEMSLELKAKVFEQVATRNARQNIKYSRKNPDPKMSDIMGFFKLNYAAFFKAGLLNMHALRKLDPNCAKYLSAHPEFASMEMPKGSIGAHQQPPAVLKSMVNSLQHLLSYERTAHRQ